MRLLELVDGATDAVYLPQRGRSASKASRVEGNRNNAHIEGPHPTAYRCALAVDLRGGLYSRVL